MFHVKQLSEKKTEVEENFRLCLKQAANTFRAGR